jgi:hypothetical protein
MERIIVRRGRFLTYELLRRTFGDDPNIEIIWDRRRPPDLHAAVVPQDGERRRAEPPVEWQRLDYLFTSGRRPETSEHEPPAS